MISHAHPLRRLSLLVALIVIASAAALAFAQGPQTPTDPAAADAAELAEEKSERARDLAARLRAQGIAQRTGDSAVEPIIHGATTWEGEQRFGGGNDWEPSIAADPNGPHVYWLTTRFGKYTGQDPAAAHPAILLRVSDDFGATWGEWKYLCLCPGGKWQYDPTIEVAADGTVYATILSRWETLVTKSTDHGATWSAPVSVETDLAWTDHGFVTVGHGEDLFVAISKVVTYVMTSHDGGETWSHPFVADVTGQNRYYYNYGGVVTPEGDVVIAETSVPLRPYAQGTVRYYAVRSTDDGATWDSILVDKVSEQPNGQDFNSRRDHFAGLSSVGMDEDGTIVMAYAASTIPGDGQAIFVKTSHDGGATWSIRHQVSPTLTENESRRVLAAFPSIVGTGEGDFRLAWQDNRNGKFRWNTWYSTSADGGQTWSEAIRISDAIAGAGYKYTAGYLSDYGDYMDIAIMSNGNTIATWGEAYSYIGPGGTWINREV